MKLHQLGSSVAILLLGMMVSSAAQSQETQGLRVRIQAPDGAGGTFSTTVPAVNGVAFLDTATGGPVNYGVFTISRCQGCAGRARVFVNTQGSVNKLVLTDAQITNTSAAGSPATLTAFISSGPIGGLLPEGTYPYATELSGFFLLTPGAVAPATDPNNKITVRATANDCGEGDCDMIDNPRQDAGEGEDPSSYSLVSPPFLAAGLSQFATKEAQNIFCNNVYVSGGDSESYTRACAPSVSLQLNVSLQGKHAARLPGSIGAFEVPKRCEPDSTEPELTKGCEIMADFFASLGPKGHKVYDVRLEPSPGPDRTEKFRTVVVNNAGVPIYSSPVAWRTTRGEDDDDEHDHESRQSNTRVRLETNGSGEVRARGLCPADGCPTSNALPVRVFCGRDTMTQTVLQLDRKGNGRAKFAFSLPCTDPAVVIMDEDGEFWVAAPAIL